MTAATTHNITVFAELLHDYFLDDVSGLGTGYIDYWQGRIPSITEVLDRSAAIPGELDRMINVLGALLATVEAAQ